MRPGAADGRRVPTASPASTVDTSATNGVSEPTRSTTTASTVHATATTSATRQVVRHARWWATARRVLSITTTGSALEAPRAPPTCHRHLVGTTWTPPDHPGVVCRTDGEASHGPLPGRVPREHRPPG